MGASVVQATGVSLRPAGHWRRMRALAWDGNRLFASRGYTLFAMEPGESSAAWQEVATYQPAAWRSLTSRMRLTYRLCRDGFHGLAPLPDGGMVGVVPGAILAL